MKKSIVTKMLLLLTVIILTSCSSVSLPTFPSFTPSSSQPIHHGALWEGSPTAIWEKLQRFSSSQLAAMQQKTNDPTKRAWIELALISKRSSLNTPSLAQALVDWRTRNPSHPANVLLPSNSTLTALATLTPPKQIALLVPQRGNFASAGQSVREGFLRAYYANSSKGSQQVKFYDTNPSQSIVAVYQRAVSEGADFVVGPLTKQNVQQLSESGVITIPTLALNYTDNSLPSQFYEFGLRPEDELAQMAARARSAGLSNAIIIAPQDAWGQRLVSSFTANWRAAGGSVEETWYYGPNTDFNQAIAHLLGVNPTADKKLARQENNQTILRQQRRQDFDVIFLLTQPQAARTIVPLLRYYYANDIPIYATSAVYSGTPNPAKDVDLNGIIICDIPWSRQVARNSASENLPSDRLYAVGQDAYLLSQTIERLVQLPNFPLYGTTGALTLSSQQIHRRIPCREVRNGLM